MARREQTLCLNARILENLQKKCYVAVVEAVGDNNYRRTVKDLERNGKRKIDLKVVIGISQWENIFPLASKADAT